MESNHSRGVLRPPGCRILSRDHELCLLLQQKLNNRVIQEIPVVDDFYQVDPKTLSERYPPFDQENEWFFFTSKHSDASKYTDRIVGNNIGFWKATTVNEVNFNGNVVGSKKTLVYYQGNHQDGVKTNWIMHEYSVANETAKLEDWVLCRIYEHNKAGLKRKRHRVD